MNKIFRIKGFVTLAIHKYTEYIKKVKMFLET